MGCADSARERDLVPELAEHVFRQLPAALYTTFVLSPLVVVVLWGHFPPGILLAWLAMIYAVSLLRLMLHRQRKRQPPGALDPARWIRHYSAGALLAGMAWGSTPLLFFSGTTPQTNVFIAFVLGGVIAGASSSMAPLKGTTRLFTVLLCLPLAIRFFIHGDSLHVVMGTMMLTYGAAYSVLSANTARMIVESFTLRHENLREIEERKRAEAELRRAQQGLERTVAERTAELRAANEELSQEIEERVQAEARLRVSEERYRNLVESSSDWIWEVDRDGTYTYSSPSVLALLGYTQQEVLGRRFHDLMPPEEAERTKALFEANKAGGRPFARVVNRCLHKDGSERIMETNGEPVLDDAGALAGYRGIDRDITLRVRHEEERRKVEHLESLGLLAGGIAHDFNNLLMGVFGNIELARSDIAPDSDAGRVLADALAAIEQTRKLTGQLLTFSRGGSPVLETTSVRDLIRDSCRLALSGTAVRCENGVPDDLWMADVDAGQIWQVLNNLLTNAREAMPDGGTVWVRAGNVTIDEASTLPVVPGDYVKVSVRDQGVGIAPDNLSRVFDPYFSTKVRGSQKGTGIGLAICHSIIEKHGGHISIESEPGRGTMVTFFLPAQGVGPTSETQAPGEPRARSRGRRILLLEDDGAVVRTTTRMLEHLGHEVAAARDGAQVLDLYSRSRRDGRPFDLVLLDLTIRGGMGGRETFEKLRLVHPGVVAIVTSGYADDPMVADYQRHGFRAALVKPFTLKTLGHTLAQVLPDGGNPGP